MKAGLDFGSTLVKAVWKTDVYQFATTEKRMQSLSELAGKLKVAGVSSIARAGIGYNSSYDSFFAPLGMMDFAGDQIKREIELQSHGAKRLLEGEGTALDDFLLVSVGTGTSYTFIEKDRITKFPIGNSLGGGFMNGMAADYGKQYEKFSAHAAEGYPLDILIKDMIPGAQGTPEGELVIANFGKVTSGASAMADLCATVVNTVAVAIVRDLMLLDMTSYPKQKDVVFIGGGIASTPVLRTRIEHYFPVTGKTAHFPNNAQYALAIGAYEQG